MKRLLAAVLVLGLAPAVRAEPTVDFSLISNPAHAGAISYAGGAAPLVGTDLFVNFVLGDDTPLNAETQFATVARLDFATGAFQGVQGNAWQFGDGGSLTITGTGPGGASGTLLSGTFTDTPTVLDLGARKYKMAGAEFVGSLDPALASFFYASREFGM